MITIPRNRSATSPDELRIKIVGLGGAGVNALDRIVLDGIAGAELVAINTDVQALTGSVAVEKVQLGRATTRGLGAGGDPEVGYAAAEEGIDEIRQSLAGAQAVILCAGLGGGTGSGAARIVASVAREHGALVVAIATMPFTFEGKRRMMQAEEALAALRGVADVVMCFENDRMGDSVSPLAGIQEAFAAADHTISQSVFALVGLMRRRGLIHTGFDELSTALRGTGSAGSRCLFGYGEADCGNRANEALARAMKNPLMDRGRMLTGAHDVLINVAGGPDMTLNEVQILMEELNRQIDDRTRILFGVAVDPASAGKMSVTILSAVESQTAPPVAALRPPARGVQASPVSAPGPRRQEAPAQQEPALAEEEPAPLAHATQQELVHAVASAATAPVREAAQPAAKPKRAEPKQEQMQFEPVTRGRFEKSEPTIVDGQDLDVPTFLRRNVKVK